MTLCSVTMTLCSERDELVSQLSVMNVHVQQLTARESDAYQQVKACIELAEQSQLDMSQVGLMYFISLLSSLNVFVTVYVSKEQHCHATD